jgi:hypothetical protein
MNRTFKITRIFLVSAAVLTICLFCFIQLSFSGAFDKKYTREELTENFIQNEKAFAEAGNLFVSKLPKLNDQKVLFGLSKGDKVSLLIIPTIVDSKTHITGGYDLELNSIQLDSALTTLGWTVETVTLLKEKLSKTNCDWISTTESLYHPIEIYPYQNGWGSFSYLIFDKPISDSLVRVFGRPISNSAFGRKVELNYTSAL